jgi:hypothetical protein
MTSQHKAHNRRNFLKGGLAAAGAATLAPALFSAPAMAQAASSTGPVPEGDLAIFKFLAAVELVESDLWTQYTLLAENNPGFQRGLTNIDQSLVRYNHDIRRDETTNALFINAALKDAGQPPTNLDKFRTLRMPRVQGSNEAGYLTNLTDLTVDTSWYTKLRSPANPDFGSKTIQLVELNGVSGIPTRDNLTEEQYQGIAWRHSILPASTRPEPVCMRTSCQRRATFAQSMSWLAFSRSRQFTLPDLTSH